jgi:hypothetical protein
VFSFTLAGAGISGGQVYGSSDKTGGYPASNRVQPPELTATIFHLLGIGHDATFRDRTGRPLPVSKGEPLWKLLGTAPATAERIVAGGNVELVPPYDDRQIRDTDFESGTSLVSHGTTERAKTWQASPIVSAEQPGAFGVILLNDPANSRGGQFHATLGFGIEGSLGKTAIPSGARAILSQEVRNPRAGKFTFSVQACGGGSSSELYRDAFLKQFVCRLVIFGFVDQKKDHRQQRPFATFEFQPAWSPNGQPKYERYQVSATLRSQDAGAMETSNGIGVAIVVERIATDPLDSHSAALSATGVPPAPAPAAFIRIDDVELTFNPRPRDDNVTV